MTSRKHRSFQASKLAVIAEPIQRVSLQPTCRAFSEVLDTTFFYREETNRYRYWYRRGTSSKPGQLSLHIKAKDLALFRASKIGGVMGEFVKIKKRGSGWFRIVSQDLTGLTEKTGATYDALKVWLHHFNRFMLGARIVVSTPRVALVRKGDMRIHSQISLCEEIKKVEASASTVPVSAKRLQQLAVTINSLRH